MILKIFRRTTVQIVKEKVFTLEPFGAHNLKYLLKNVFLEKLALYFACQNSRTSFIINLPNLLWSYDLNKNSTVCTM